MRTVLLWMVTIGILIYPTYLGMSTGPHLSTAMGVIFVSAAVLVKLSPEFRIVRLSLGLLGLASAAWGAFLFWTGNY